MFKKIQKLPDFFGTGPATALNFSLEPTIWPSIVLRTFQIQFSRHPATQDRHFQIVLFSTKQKIDSLIYNYLCLLPQSWIDLLVQTHRPGLS